VNRQDEGLSAIRTDRNTLKSYGHIWNSMELSKTKPHQKQGQTDREQPRGAEEVAQRLGLFAPLLPVVYV